jgi:ubiquinone biosynthesis protein
MFIIISNFIKILRIIAQEHLITNNKYKLPIAIKFLGYFAIIFAPFSLFRKPKDLFGNRLIRAVTNLGPIYIKFAQILSTRDDILGSFADELKLVQDILPSFDTSISKNTIFKSFKKHAEEIFEYFEDIPIATASISQVHKAKLYNGEIVAVKILRPNIHKQYNNDIKLLYAYAKILNILYPELKRLKLISVVDIFHDIMKFELDLRMEGAAASEMKDNFTKNHKIMDQNLYIPKIYWDYTSEHILTTEFIDAISIYEVDHIISNSTNRRIIAQNLAVIFFNQIFRDGFFHADLHPGNIFITEDLKIILLDFGIMGRLPQNDRIYIAKIVNAFFNRNYDLVAHLHLKAGYIPPNSNLELFAQSCRAIAEPIIIDAKNIIISNLLSHLFKVTEDFGMEVQPQLILLQKTVIMIETIGRIIDPEVNIWKLAEPWIKDWGYRNLNPIASFSRIIKNIIHKINNSNFDFL